jgi:dTDP-4-amino-4,6-dideoxygalactose transaminase
VIKRSVIEAGAEEYGAVKRVLDSGRYILGDETKSLEREFGDYCDSKYCVAVNSGTSALLLSLLAIGVKGKEVITVPNSFVATANAIVWAGGKPVFVDVEENTHNMDADKLADAITVDTAAIVPVDLYGHPYDIKNIKKIAEEEQLPIIEDACQGHGSEYKGKKIGGISDVTCFSLFPSKNITAFGDGGLITTNDEKIYNQLVMLRNQGRKSKDDCEVFSLNFRLSEIHAALAREQLKKLDSFVNMRSDRAAGYNFLLDGVGLPIEMDNYKHCYHLYTILCDRRDDLKKYLDYQGIETSVNYPLPIHKQTAYRELCNGVSMPVAEELSKKILSIPMYPTLASEEIETVCCAIERFYKK